MREYSARFSYRRLYRRVLRCISRTRISVLPVMVKPSFQFLPGPIGSPGLPAIEAVLAAEPGDYLYYVAQADGHHVFTRSYEEHQQETENIYGSSS